MAVSEPLTLPDQLRSMRQSVDADTGAILFRHPTLHGIHGPPAGRTDQAATSGGPWPLSVQGPADLAARTTSGVSTPEIPKRAGRASP